MRTTTAVGPGSPGGCRPAAARRVAPRATSRGFPRGSRVVTREPEGSQRVRLHGREVVPSRFSPGRRGVRPAGRRGGRRPMGRPQRRRAPSGPSPVGQGVLADPVHVLHGHGLPSLPRCEGRGGLADDEVGPEPFHALPAAAGRDLRGHLSRDPDPGEDRPCGEEAGAEPLLLRSPQRPEADGVHFEGRDTRGRLGPLARIRQVFGGHQQAEPVEELGPQLPLLGIHGAHQDEPARVADRHALALHDRHAARRHVQEEVHQVVREQVDLVHVEDPAVGPGQKTRLKPLLAPAESPLEVEGAHDPVFRGAQGERHEGGRSLLHLDLAAQLAGVQGIAPRRAVPVGGERRQEGRQGAGGAGLGRPAPPHDEHAADPGIDGGEEERELHALLPHDGGNGERDHSLTSTSASLRR